MHEPLTTPLLLDLLQKLHVAFPRTLGKDNPAMMAEVYRNGLRGLSGNAVKEAVEKCIQQDQYYPKVARIREVASEIIRRTTVTLQHTASWDRCGVCGVAVTKSAGGRMMLDHDPRAHGIRVDAEQASA